MHLPSIFFHIIVGALAVVHSLYRKIFDVTLRLGGRARWFPELHIKSLEYVNIVGGSRKIAGMG